MFFLIWSVVLAAAVTLYFRQVYTRFSRHGVKNFTPIPIIGNMFRIITRRDHFVDDIQRLYKTFPEERFVGKYEFTNVLVMVRDLELVKKIVVKDFEHFVDHRTIIDESVDPFFGRNLFAMKGDEWKDMRSTLSPAFTSSKIRVMVPFMMEVGDQMISNLKKRIQETGDNYEDVDVKDLTTRYANDVIASCAFGLKVDSLTEKNNEFYKMGKASSTFNFYQLILFLLFAACPNLMRRLRISFFAEEHKEFFRHLVMSTMENREKNNIVRPDMIHLLMEAKKGKLTHEEKVKDADAGFSTVEESFVGKKEVTRQWADIDLIAQAVIFFIAGFESISGVMCMALHELAVNPDIQEKLAEEIKNHDEKNGGKFDYNSMQQMTYLDMVVSEVLRFWPAGVALDRLCTKDYNMGRPNSKSAEDFILRKGEGVSIPVWAFHRDPQYFPNPDKFDPERFSDENKHNIPTMAYMPFGLGPRNCIGSRFALCEVKVMLYQLIQHFELSACPKTCIPAVLSTETFNLRLKGGHWIRFQPRN